MSCWLHPPNTTFAAEFSRWNGVARAALMAKLGQWCWFIESGGHQFLCSSGRNDFVGVTATTAASSAIWVQFVWTPHDKGFAVRSLTLKVTLMPIVASGMLMSSGQSFVFWNFLLWSVFAARWKISVGFNCLMWVWCEKQWGAGHTCFNAESAKRK